MYKDKAKQREADRERQKRYRAWKASGGVTQGVTNQGVTDEDVTSTIDGSMPDSYYEKIKACKHLKRGRDIKSFDDLPPDVQQTIRTISESNEEFKRRTSIAITYQHTFPGRY